MSSEVFDPVSRLLSVYESVRVINNFLTKKAFRVNEVLRGAHKKEQQLPYKRTGNTELILGCSLVLVPTNVALREFV